MPFDSELVFHDGTTITATITPTSVTRSSGSVVLDLKETGAHGLTAVLIMGADLAAASDTLIVTIQGSTAANGTYYPLATFATLTQGGGMPGTYMRHFATTYRYVRALITISDYDGGGDFTVADVSILLSPYPFYNL